MNYSEEQLYGYILLIFSVDDVQLKHRVYKYQEYKQNNILVKRGQ